MTNYKQTEARYIKSVDSAIERFFEFRKKETQFTEITRSYELMQEFCLRPGKRVRPVLMLLACEGYNSQIATESVIECAALIEIMHSFLLIHDDIVDNADFRRGAPSLHRMFPGNTRAGEALALVSADMLIFDVLSHIMQSDLDDAIRKLFLACFSRCYHSTCVGQILDLKASGGGLDDTAAPYRVAHYKTAFYTFVYPVLFGSILSGENDLNQHRLIEELFVEPGIAFQIRDDYIGIFSSEDDSGKSAAVDLHECKVTTIIADAAALMKESEKNEFADLFFKMEKTESDIILLRKLITKTGILQKIDKRLTNTASNFKNGIEALDVSEEYKGYFLQIVKQVCMLPLKISGEINE
ncbi:MAG: polyprenyl synthetase family protein [Spirochaetes bacterium]|jgi:geranylgeranyl diphosphate synthase type I|nr:polyprenyl synthetase family protein [Spirochaetota bacterium]